MGSNLQSRRAVRPAGRTVGLIFLLGSALVGTTQCVLPRKHYDPEATGAASSADGSGGGAGFGGEGSGGATGGSPTGGNGAGTGGSPQECQDCTSTQACVNGTCLDQSCEPKEIFCSGSDVHECDDNGFGSTVLDSCGEDEYCDAVGGTCREGVCAPSQPTCTQNIARICNSQGTGYVADSAVDCTNQAKTCVSGSCQGACAPEQTKCSNNGVQTCNASGQYGVADPCEDTTCLGEDGSASCQGECAPNQTRCADNALETCDEATGQYGEGIGCEAQDQTCLGSDGSASCEGECAPDQTACSGNDLEACNEATGMYGTPNTCQNSTCLGDPGDASCQGVCEPGQEQCMGNGVAECDETDGQYDTPTPCPTTAPHCAGATCGDPPSCQGNLLADCGSGSNEYCCTSLIVPGGTYNRINDSDYEATVATFRLDKFEVTVGRWRRFVAAWEDEDNPWRPPAGAGKHVHLHGGQGLLNSDPGGGYESGWDSTWTGSVSTSDAAHGEGTTYATWTTDPEGNETRPMNYVSWYEAYAFCIWDGGFLPSEAEWNYAAAGGGNPYRQYPWGSASPDCTRANFFNGAACFPGYTSDVGVTNGVGLYGQEDLAGNVSEWNLDWHEATATAFLLVPCVNCAYLPAPTSGREHRGGGYNSTAAGLPTTVRAGDLPTSRFSGTGIRCARAP